jgi:hypothetical protein
MSKKKKVPTVKQDTEIDPRFNDAWANKWHNVLDNESSSERNNTLGDVHDAEEATQISKLMTLGQMMDMMEWCADVEHGVDPPFHWARIPLGERRSVPLPFVSFFFLIFLITSVVAGVRIGGLCLITIGFGATLVAMAITLARYHHNESGKCLQCGMEIDDDIDLKVVNRKGELVSFTDAGLCNPNVPDTNNCEWVHYRHGMWVTLYHQRLDTIFQKKYRIRIGWWKDPFPGGNGATYTWKHRKNPYDREDQVIWDRIERRNRENDQDIKLLRKRGKKRRLSFI